jgi:hypothetical protein
MKLAICSLSLLTCTVSVWAQTGQAPHPARSGAELYRSNAFTVTDTSVRQGRYEAIALSRDTIVSSYPRAAREVHFKFSINSEENEFRPGTEHTIFVRPQAGRIVTPVYAFGIIEPPHIPTPEESASSEDGLAQTTFRLDMRGVLRSFRDRGYYDPPNGPRIRAQDFEGVYVIGSPEPLTWDFRSLRPGSPLQLTDPDRDTIYTVTVPVEAMYTRPLGTNGRAIWARNLDVSRFPQLTSPERLIDALYRMSLEELQQLVRDDGAFSAGAKWPGVWTRDISLSAVLGLAMIAPDATRKSLMAKVDSAGRIIQDTGTGGSWPMSSDRTAWALAAWEVYAVTGDRGWLRSAYDIIRHSVEADLHAAFDPATGLFRGESSFEDWREQSYPRWMDPKDIYQGKALGTNAIHYATYRILADMSRALREPSARWDAIADTVRKGMNDHLWQANRGWYGQYRYGRNFSSLSPRSDGLGEALTIIYGVATPSRGSRLAASAPVVEFGEPSFWPYIPGEALYHNAAIWPFVNAYWTWAAADAGNTAGVEHGLATIYRPAALFLTNKENMVAATGHFEGTVLNSDRQLWSVAGNLAMTYRVLFGIRLLPDRMAFKPMTPRAYSGERTLRNLPYRGAMLTVTVRGFGDGVARASLDGRRIARAEVPGGLTGAHTLELEMNGRWPAARIAVVENRVAPATPRAELRGDSLVWPPVNGAASYAIYRDGQRVAVTRVPRALVRHEDGLAEYQVLATDAAGFESFLSEPARVVTDSAVRIIKPPSHLFERVYAGFTGAGYVPLTLERNTSVDIPFSVSASGAYSIDVRYANGNGPINSGDKAAVRTLLVDGKPAGILVMPHRGTDLWTDWGFSNPVRVALSAGAHRLTISYTALDQNMNRHENTALLDQVRVTPLASRSRQPH